MKVCNQIRLKKQSEIEEIGENDRVKQNKSEWQLQEEKNEINILKQKKIQMEAKDKKISNNLFSSDDVRKISMSIEKKYNKNDEDGNFNEREFLIQNPQLIPLNPLLIIDR